MYVWYSLYHFQVVPNRLHFKRSLFLLYPGIRVTVSSFLLNLSISKTFWSDFEFFWHLLTNEKIQLSLQDIIVRIVTTKCPSHHLLNYMVLIGKIYLWVCRTNKTSPKTHGFKKNDCGKSKILLHSLVTCHLDYCNALLHDIPQHQQQRLQKVLNAAAHFVYQLPKFCHITPVLKALHWLPVKYRIMFKIILLVFKILHGLAPTYLQDLIKVKPPSRYQLRSDDKFFLVVPKTKCKTFGDRAFYKAGPDLWNHLPLSLRNTL